MIGIGILGLLGLPAVIASFLIQSEYARGYFMGTGAGLLGFSIIILARKALLLKDEARLRAARIEEEDERNQFLSYKSSHYALVVSIFAAYASSIYFAFTNRAVMHLLTIFICVLAFLRVLIYMVMKKNT